MSGNYLQIKAITKAPESADIGSVAIKSLLLATIKWKQSLKLCLAIYINIKLNITSVRQQKHRHTIEKDWRLNKNNLDEKSLVRNRYHRIPHQTGKQHKHLGRHHV